MALTVVPADNSLFLRNVNPADRIAVCGLG